MQQRFDALASQLPGSRSRRSSQDCGRGVLLLLQLRERLHWQPTDGLVQRPDRSFMPPSQYLDRQWLDSDHRKRPLSVSVGA